MREQDGSGATPVVAAPTVIGGALRPPRRAAPEAARSADDRPVRIALLDDDEQLLDRAASWLRRHAPDLEVAVTATSWLELVHSPAFPADVVLLDLQLKEPVSIEARVRTCRAAGAAVIVLAGVDADDVRERAMHAGAAAFLSTSRPLSEVLEVARDVAAGTRGRSRPEEWRPLPQAVAGPQRPRLSAAEQKALRLYIDGRSVDEVAHAMSVRFETAKTYLRRVREKYARVQRPASRKVDLMRRAAEDGYLG